MRKRLSARVEGRVQMVMFRDFVTRHARKLGICGQVWNEHDGSVRVLAEGEEGSLLALLELLKVGPILAHVEHVEEIWSDADDSFDSFTIRYN